MPGMSSTGMPAPRLRRTMRSTRRAIRTPRAAAVAGLVFALLLTSSLVLIRLAVTDEAEAGSWVTDDARRTVVVVCLSLTPIAGIAFLWFIGVVRDRIGEGEDRFLSSVFIGSGLLFVAMLFVTAAITSALVTTAAEASPDQETQDLWELGTRIVFNLATIYAMRMAAVFTIATTTITATLGIVPRWLVVTGYATAALLLLTAGFIPWIELAFPLWVAALSAHFLRRLREASA